MTTGTAIAGIVPALTLASTLILGCRSDTTGAVQARIDHALQRMRDQPRADAYGASAFFEDGKVMQTPPSGTIARERVLDPELATGRDSSGAYRQVEPMPVTAALLARGRDRFGIFCAACHGAGGFGGSFVAANLVERRPPSLRSGVVAGLPAGRIYEAITNGFGRMPSYAAELPVADRWAVVAYVRSFRDRPPADAEERDDSARATELRRRDSSSAAAAP